MLPNHNGLGVEPSVPAPIRSGAVTIELPASLDMKMTLSDFHFIKVSCVGVVSWSVDVVVKI